MGSIQRSSIHAVPALIVLGALLFATGCGDNMQVAQTVMPTPTPLASPTPTPAPSPTPTPAPAFTSAQIRLGDAPANRVIGFEVTFGPSPLLVTLSTGQSVSLVVQNNRWELSHMAGKMEPLSIQSFPEGIVTSIQIPLSDPEVTYLDNLGAVHTFSGAPSQTVTVNLSPPLTIGSNPAIVTVDLNVASTLTFDPAGAVTAIAFSGSTFTFGTKAIAAEAEQQDDNGEIEGVTGKVTLVNGSSFQLDAGQGAAAITFVTDGTTKLENAVTLASLLNQIVKVEGFTQADGSLFAKEVEKVASDSGSEFEGVIIDEDGPPLSSNPPSIRVLVQDGNGNGMGPSIIGQSFLVAIDSSKFSNYTIDWGKIVNVGGSFNGREISPGQRVEVELPGGIPALGVMTDVPVEIKLEQQAINGQVKNFTPGIGGAAEFDLNLPPDSFITLLTKVTSAHVFVKPETDMKVQAIANDDTIRVRGLLFFHLTADPANLGPKPWGIFGMIARRITAP
jgi:hypothetical protein